VPAPGLARFQYAPSRGAAPQQPSLPSRVPNPHGPLGRLLASRAAAAAPAPAQLPPQSQHQALGSWQPPQPCAQQQPHPPQPFTYGQPPPAQYGQQRAQSPRSPSAAYAAAQPTPGPSQQWHSHDAHEGNVPGAPPGLVAPSSYAPPTDAGLGNAFAWTQDPFLVSQLNRGGR